MIPVILLVLTSVAGHRVVDSTEDIPPPVAPLVTTTLYPVNATTTSSSPKPDTKIKSATSWKIETTFGSSKLETNSTDSKEVQSKEVPVERPANSSSSQEFRPSQHLGDFVDEDTFNVGPTRGTDEAFSAVIKKPPTGFIGSPKEQFRSQINKIPKDIFKNYQEIPYKFEPAILTKAKDGWKPGTPTPPGLGLQETKPTAEIPVRVPAGGLYKLPDPFKEKPGFGDDDFGLEFSSDGKEHGLKRPRVNPWKKLVHFLTALIPVGIIFSALTPNVITVEPGLHQIQPNNVFRRGDGQFVHIPPISERCRRRLLCELHSETNYSQSNYGSRRGKQCHRLHCEDPDSLARTLQYLLSYHRPTARDADYT